VHFTLNDDHIHLFNFNLSFPILFLGAFLSIGEYPGQNSFGLEYMSWEMGLLLLSGIVLSIKMTRTNYLIKLMQFLILGIIMVSLLFWQAWSVHYNVMLFPAIILTAAFLNKIWAKNRIFKYLIILFALFYLFNVPKNIAQIKNTYSHWSLMPLYAWLNNDQHINAQEINTALIPIIKKYNPSLTVAPNSDWDTIITYVGVESGLKTLSPLRIPYDSINYFSEDWRRIVILDNIEANLEPYIDWAKSNNQYDVSITKEHIQLFINHNEVLLPLTVVLLNLKEGSSLIGNINEQLYIDKFILETIKNKL